MAEGTLEVVNGSKQGRKKPWATPGYTDHMGVERGTNAKDPHSGWPEGFSDDIQLDHRSDVSDVVGCRNDELSPEMLFKHKERKKQHLRNKSRQYSESVSDSVSPGEAVFPEGSAQLEN